MTALKPKDSIAILVIVAYVILKILRVDGALDPALFLILGYYFAHRQNGTDNGK